MSSNTRSARQWFWAWWPVLLMTAVLSFESTTLLGSNETDGPLRMVWQALFGHLSDARWGIIHHYIRKTGHFSGYGLTGLAWLRAWRFTMPRRSFLWCGVLALLATAAMATADEVHQAFLPNRTGTPWDVLLDCSGALIMQLLAYGYMRALRPGALQPA